MNNKYSNRLYLLTYSRLHTILYGLPAASEYETLINGCLYLKIHTPVKRLSRDYMRYIIGKLLRGRSP